MRGKRKREHSRWPTVQIPLDLFVYITLFSFCPSPSFPLPLSFFRASLSLTQTPTCCNRTADKYTDSCNHQIILLHLKRNGTPTALTYATVNYSIQRTRGEPPAPQTDARGTAETTYKTELSPLRHIWKLYHPVILIMKMSLKQNVVSRLLISSLCHVTPLTP